MKDVKLLDFIHFQKFMLTFLGLWPLPHETYRLKKFLHGMKGLIVAGCSYSLLFSLGLFIYQNIDNKEALADTLYFVMTQIALVLKLTLFASKRQKIFKIVQQIEANVFKFKSAQKKFVLKWYTFGDNLVKFYFTVCYLAFAFSVTFPILDKDEENILPFKGWFPVDVKQNLVNRGFVYAFHVYTLGTSIGVNASLDTLACSFMNIATAEVEVLRNNLEHAVKGSDDGEVVELISKEADDELCHELKKCVNHQEAIGKFLKDIEDLLGLGMFIQFISSGIVICITGLQLILLPPASIKFVWMLNYLTGMIMQISIYCWNGNEVLLESSGILGSCYKMEWYRSSVKARGLLFVIMEKSKVPMKLTAGKFFVLSVPTLITILRSAYSYFAVLRQVYSED